MKSSLAAVDRLIEALIVIVFLAVVVVGFAQVFNRYVLNASLSWSEEFQRYGQIWLIFLAIPVAYRRGLHIGLELLQPRLSAFGRRVFAFAIDILWLVLGSVLVFSTLQLMQVLQFQRSPGLGLPMTWAYGGLLVGGVYMVIVCLRRMASNIMGSLPEDRPFGDDHVQQE